MVSGRDPGADRSRLPAEPATSRKAQAAQTEAALKEAALRVFARNGYHSAKITDITTEARRSAGSFYTHFTGKDDVLRALLADWLAQAGAELAADPAGDDLSQEPALRARVAACWHASSASGRTPENRSARIASWSFRWRAVTGLRADRPPSAVPPAYAPYRPDQCHLFGHPPAVWLAACVRK